MQASSRFVRASRFRHVFAEPAKPELHYTDLDLSPVTGDHSYIKGNGKYFVVAVRGGGGPVQVIPYTLVRLLPQPLAACAPRCSSGRIACPAIFCALC